MANEVDVVVVGGGHNGLAAAAYLGQAGLDVLLLETRAQLGGACGTFEFMPGYRTSMANSPGSLERRVVDELELEKHGLRFVATDPTLVHFFDDDAYVNWRDADRNEQSFEAFSPGEYQRQRDLIARFERAAAAMGVSVFEAPPPMSQILESAKAAGEEEMVNRILFGSLSDLLNSSLKSEKAKVLLCMVALNATLTPPSAPGSGVGLLMRPLSLASASITNGNDFRKHVLRGSVGLPIGSMGAIVDALVAAGTAHDVTYRTSSTVEHIHTRNGGVSSVVLASGEEIKTKRVISAINPKTLFSRILSRDDVDREIAERISSMTMRGSTFKIVLGLDGIPSYRGLPPGVSAAEVVPCQFRIAPSVRYYEDSILDALRGRPSEGPIIWGLFQTPTSPNLAPKNRHLLSVNVWHAPYELREGSWTQETPRFGWHCVDILEQHMPGLKDRITEHRFMGPVEIEEEFGLVQSGITHGDMLPNNLFAGRPDPGISNYRAPLDGLYLSGAGVWPGGYVTCLPGRNVSEVVLNDIKNMRKA